MFDFRYHALSLAAVFLALGIGIVLGATLGDSVISEANKDVRSSLQGDLLDARGDRLAHALQNQFPDAFNGDLKGADAVVYYRSAENRNDEAKTFESALIEGLRSGGVPVVGVEESDASQSQVPFYERAAISTVDD